MTFDAFMERLSAKAAQVGMETYEVYYTAGDSFRVTAFGGKVDDYRVSSREGLSFRAMIGECMGLSYSEVLDEAAADMLVQRAAETAEVLKDQEPQILFDGKGAQYAQLELYHPCLEDVTSQQKIEIALAMEKSALAMEGVRSVGHCQVVYGSSQVRLVNSLGLNLQEKSNHMVAYLDAVVEENGDTVDGAAFWMGHDFAQLDPEALAKEAVAVARAKLGAASVLSGARSILLDREAMADLLATFSGMYSAENAQKGLSRLAGQEGEMVAASCVTLLDDPLMLEGESASSFDAQGVPTYTKAIIQDGRLETLLHNLETAAKANGKTTGNAARPGYKGKVSVAPSNLRLLPGNRTPEEIMTDMGDGLVITEVSGLHAGANGATGDFSLTAQGFVVENGKKGRAVNQITVAGNFYTLMKDVVELANDCRITFSGVETPSVWVKSLMVAGE